jgi:hypothetical protein
MDTAKVAEYARLRRIQKARTEEAQAAKEQADAMMDELIEAFVADAVPSLPIDGTTVYLETRIVAGKRPDVEPERFHDALRACGLGDFVKPTVAANTLAAYARELDENDQPLPEPLRDVLNVHHITTLKTRPAGQSKTLKRLQAAS